MEISNEFLIYPCKFRKPAQLYLFGADKLPVAVRTPTDTFVRRFRTRPERFLFVENKWHKHYSKNVLERHFLEGIPYDIRI